MFVFLGDFWTDENWYYAGSWIVAEGGLPHVDFFIHHNPLVFYLYALGQRLAGPSLLVGRLQSWMIWLGAVALLARLAWKSGDGARSATLCLALVGTNPFAIRYFTAFGWRPVEALLLAGALSVLAAERWRAWRYATVSALLALVVVLRYPVDLSSVVLLTMLGYVAVRERRRPAVVLVTAASAFGVLALFLLPFVLWVPQRYAFDVVTFPFSQVTLGHAFGVLRNTLTVAGRLDAAVSQFAVEVRTFFAVLVLFVCVGLGRSLESRFSGGSWFAWLRHREEWWWLVVFYVVSGEAAMLWYGQAATVTRIVPFLLLTLLVSVELGRWSAALASSLANSVLWASVAVLVVASAWLQLGGDIGLSARWSTSDVFRIRRAAAAVEATTPPGRPVLSFSPALVTEAKRPLALGMVMEVWSVFPTWDTRKSAALNLVNVPMLLDELRARRAGAVVLLRPGRLEDDVGMGAILAPYRDRFRMALDAGYRNVASVPGPRGSRPEPVWVDIYLPR